MGIKLIWIGVFLLIAVSKALSLFAISVSGLIEVVGAVVFAIGLFFLLKDK